MSIFNQNFDQLSIMKPLIQKEILKRHKKNPKDKQLQKDIETKEIKRSDFNKLIQQSTKPKPFDKKK